jgi:hypothetical protein
MARVIPRQQATRVGEEMKKDTGAQFETLVDGKPRSKRPPYPRGRVVSNNGLLLNCADVLLERSIGGWGLLTPRQPCGVTLPSIPTLCPERNPRHGRRVPIGRLCSGCARFLDLVRRFWPRGMRCN